MNKLMKMNRLALAMTLAAPLAMIGCGGVAWILAEHCEHPRAADQGVLIMGFVSEDTMHNR